MKPSPNPWPFAIIAAFAIFISGTVGLVILACSQKLDLVSADYYEQEIRFQSHLERLHRTGGLGTQASVVYDSSSQWITISISLPKAHQPLAGRIQLYRPSSANLDRQFALSLDSSGCQRLGTADLAPGLWQIRVSWTSKNQDFFIDKRVVIKPPPRHVAAAYIPGSPIPEHPGRKLEFGVSAQAGALSLEL